MTKDYTLTPKAAAELFEQLTGRAVKRQQLQQLADRGDIPFEEHEITVRVRMFSPSDIERLAREGLPNRGAGGRPRKNAKDTPAE